MKIERKDLLVAVQVAVLIAINVLGKALVMQLSLPLWLDSFGTVVAAYVFGPIDGAIVGLAGNLVYGIYHELPVVYGIASILVGVIVGISARKGRFETLFGTLSCASVVTLACVAIATPINILMWAGKTGNVWGDGVSEFFQRVGLNGILSCALGEFYVDFADKVLTLVALYAALHLWRRFRERKEGTAPASDAVPPAALSVLLVLVLAAAFPSSAQAVLHVEGQDVKPIDFYATTQTVYSSANGLPCGEANDIAQTRDGVLWIGTYAGLYRYSGTDFVAMNEYESVRNVNCLYVDSEGRLWVGTNDNGLVLIVNEHVSNVLDVNRLLPSNSVRAITQSTSGAYYVGTSAALQIIDLSSGMRLLAKVPDVTYAKSLSSDSQGHVAATTGSGELCVLEGETIVARAELPSDDGVFTCCEYDENDRLLVGSSEGVMYTYEMDGDTLRLADTCAFEGLQKLNSLNMVGGGLLFACADNGVASRDAKGQVKLLNLGDFNNSIDNMLVDYQGNYWFTSSRLGLLRMAASSFSDVYEAANAEHRLSNAVVRWQDNLYIATDTGLDVIDTQGGTAVQNSLTSMLDGIRIRCLRVGANGHLWICSYGLGLIEVDEQGNTTLYDADAGFCDRVRVALELSDGTIAAAGDTGLAFIKGGKVEEVLEYGPDFCNAQVLCMYQNDNGMLYVGTDGDGILVLKNRAVWRRVTSQGGLSSNIILRMVPTANGAGLYVVTSNSLCVIVGGEARPLRHFPYSNNFDVWTTKSGRVFVLGSAGIYVVREDDLLAEDYPKLSYELLDSKRGLVSAITANSWCWREGHDLYIPTDEGVLLLNVGNYGSTQSSYRMKLSSVMLDDVLHHVERGTVTTIGSDVDRVVLHPEIISYALDDPYVSYKLEGYDRRATTVRRSELSDVNYTNLPSGDYQFWIAVLDNDKNVLEESTYPLHREPEIYETSPFKVYLVLVGGIAMAWAGWFVARKQSERTLELQRQQLEFAQRQVQLGNQTVMAIARTVDAKDVRTAHHSQRVSEYSVMLGRELGFSDEECENLRKAALLHDIGKIGIPDRILNKPSRLTDDEYATMKTHVTVGADILKGFTMIDHVVEGALYHHERYDGRGYVSGIAGEEIPLYGRIISVADTFDAMTQNRVYRTGRDMDYVIGELERGKGTQFDPVIAEIMLRLVREGKCDEILNVGKETDVAQKKDEDADGEKAEAGAEDKTTKDKKQEEES